MSPLQGITVPSHRKPFRVQKLWNPLRQSHGSRHLVPRTSWVSQQPPRKYSEQTLLNHHGKLVQTWRESSLQSYRLPFLSANDLPYFEIEHQASGKLLKDEATCPGRKGSKVTLKTQVQLHFGEKSRIVSHFPGISEKYS